MPKIQPSSIKALAKALGHIPERDLATMTAIALAESGGDTGAQNKSNSNGTWDSGLWQVNDIWKGQDNTSGNVATFRQQMLDGNRNASMAGHIYRTQGLTAWSVYKNGKYKAHMATAEEAEGDSHDAGLFESARGVAESVIDNPLEGIDAVAAAVAQVGDAFSTIVEWVTDPNVWKRVALVVAGLGLAYVSFGTLARPLVEPATELIGAIK